MRLMPAQIGMWLFLGTALPNGLGRNQTIAERIETGRAWLMKCTRQDFGYDALHWHEYLWETNAGGYKSSRRDYEKWRRVVSDAAQRPEWVAAVSELQSR
jgi:hypothetical protein